MYFLIEDDDIRKNIILFGIKSTLILKNIDSEPAYNKKFLQAKNTSHSDKVTDFCDKAISKTDSHHTCLTVISLDSALN